MDDSLVATIRSCMDTVIGTVDTIFKVYPEDGELRDLEIDGLRKTLTNLAKSEADYLNKSDSVDAVRNRLREMADEGEVSGADMNVDMMLSQHVRNEGVKEQDHPKVLELEARIARAKAEAQRETEFSPGQVEDQQDQGGEVDLVETRVTRSLIDPITKRKMEDPVKNTLCGHSYDRASILELIRRSKRTKCPIPGCANRNPVTEDNLIDDTELASIIHRETTENKGQRVKKTARVP